MRLLLAFRLFFSVLLDRETAERAANLVALPAPSPPDASEPRAQPPRPAASPPARDNAITLLATLQREARFVDIVMEPLGDYSDAQIGAAARDVLRDCAGVLQRLFDLQPIIDADDGAEYQTPAEVDAGRLHLTGSVSGSPPFTGRLVHHGWEARQCQLPKWTGSSQSARVVAPAELEV